MKEKGGNLPIVQAATGGKVNMSKLSASLKALIGAAHARPNTLPAPPRIRSVYERLRQEAAAKNVGTTAWLSMSVSIVSLVPGGC
jgi:hypothetical protein